MSSIKQGALESTLLNLPEAVPGKRGLRSSFIHSFPILLCNNLVTMTPQPVLAALLIAALLCVSPASALAPRKLLTSSSASASASAQATAIGSLGEAAAGAALVVAWLPLQPLSCALLQPRTTMPSLPAASAFSSASAEASGKSASAIAQAAASAQSLGTMSQAAAQAFAQAASSSAGALVAEGSAKDALLPQRCCVALSSGPAQALHKHAVVCPAALMTCRELRRRSGSEPGNRSEQSQRSGHRRRRRPRLHHPARRQCAAGQVLEAGGCCRLSALPLAGLLACGLEQQTSCQFCALIEPSAMESPTPARSLPCPTLPYPCANLPAAPADPG